MHRVVSVGRHLIVEPKIAHRATLVWLHGLGDSAAGFAELFSDPDYTLPYLKTVLLTADPHPVTLNGGMVMNSWYDIDQIGERSLRQDALDSAEKVSLTLAEEEKHTQNLFVGGFSQGGALALLLAYSRYPGIVKGVIALSCYSFSDLIPEARRRIPALIYHGEADSLIPVRLARDSYTQNLANVSYTLKTIPRLEHSIDPQELTDIRAWLQTQVKTTHL